VLNRDAEENFRRDGATDTVNVTPGSPLALPN
jgi:hypothetical protein